MYKLEIKMPTLDGGAKIAIPGIGEVGNGKHEVTDEDAELFRVLGSHLEYAEGVEPNELGQVPVVSVLGPTLAEAFKDNEYIKVTEVKSTNTGGGDK